MRYANLKMKPAQKKQFDNIAKELINTGLAKDNIEAFQYILDTFGAAKEKKTKEDKTSYTSEEKAQVFASIIHKHNETEKKKRGERNYINIPSINFIYQETGINAARLDKNVKAEILERAKKQADVLKFDGSENQNPIMSEQVEVKIKTRIVNRRAFVQQLLQKSAYSKMFGF